MRKLMQAFDIYGAEAGIEPARPYERGILNPPTGDCLKKQVDGFKRTGGKLFGAVT
jgi:hypothetical protein